MMEKELHEKWIEIKEKIKSLPEKVQLAICWVIKNFDLATKLCKESNMTYEEIEECRKRAMEKEDYLLIALLHLAKAYKDKDMKL